MFARLPRILTAVLPAVVTTAGCRHLPDRGRSSYEFVKTARATAYRPVLVDDQPHDLFLPARPLPPLALPAFPPRALAAHVGRTTLMLDLTIGPDGRVVGIVPALGGIPWLGPFAADFRAAAEATVAQWRFEPAQLRHVEPRKDDGTTVWSVTRTQPVEMTVEVAVTFTETTGPIEPVR